MALLYFLYKNGKWLRIGNVELYNFARGIAKSRPNSREKVILQIQIVIRKYLVDLE